jgi:hypothetical protein
MRVFKAGSAFHRGFPAEDAGEEGFLINRADFLLDPPDFIFIFALQGGVLHRFPQALLSLALHFVKIAICPCLSSWFHDVLHSVCSNKVTHAENTISNKIWNTYRERLIRAEGMQGHFNGDSWAFDPNQAQSCHLHSNETDPMPSRARQMESLSNRAGHFS